MHDGQFTTALFRLDHEFVRAQAPLPGRALHDEEHRTVGRIVRASRDAPERPPVDKARRCVERRMYVPLADVLHSAVGAGNLAVKDSLKKRLVAQEEVPSSNCSRAGPGGDRDFEDALDYVAADEDPAGFGLGRRAYVCRDS